MDSEVLLLLRFTPLLGRVICPWEPLAMSLFSITRYKCVLWSTTFYKFLSKRARFCLVGFGLDTYWIDKPSVPLLIGYIRPLHHWTILMCWYVELIQYYDFLEYSIVPMTISGHNSQSSNQYTLACISTANGVKHIPDDAN